MRQGIHTISFIGLGLVGTSLMQALKRASVLAERPIKTIGFDPAFVGKDIDAITSICGLDKYAFTEKEQCDADLIVLCAPVLANIYLLDRVKKYAKKGVLITDVSSTKADIDARAKELKLNFIGMHPIAGREQQGYRAASPEMLEGQTVIICSGEKLPKSGHAAELINLLRKAGCKPTAMSPEAHDRVYANISHLPQLVSTALMEHCRENLAWGGPGFASMARLAGSPWPVWRDIVDTNLDNIARELEDFSASLAGIASEVREKNFEALESRFREANQLYQRLQERNGS